MDRSSASVMDNIAEGFDRFSKTISAFSGHGARFNCSIQISAFPRRRSEHSQQLFESMKTASAYLGVKLHHFISYLPTAEFKTRPDAKDLTAESGLLSESSVAFTIPSEYDFPQELLHM